MLAATIQARPLTTLDTTQQRSSGWADTIVRMNLRARRSGGACGFRPAEVAVGSLAGNGTAVKLGTIKLDLAGGAWQLPASEEIRTGRSLSERGWNGVVPHRWQDRIRTGSRRIHSRWSGPQQSVQTARWTTNTCVDALKATGLSALIPKYPM
jgi:hypothetical protein